jgi:RsmE family RNA methyltransferase
MVMNLILLDAPDFTEPAVARLTDGRARHITSVLKAKPGATLRIGLLNGPRGVGTLLAGTEHDVLLACAFEAKPTPRPPLDLLLALPRPKVLKRLWAQLAALGVDRIILTNAARVERNYFDTHVVEPAFYTPLLVEGLQQAQDTHLPRVSIHRQLKPLIEDELDPLSDAPIRLLADPAAVTSTPAPGGPTRTLLAVGPEGGWVDFERDLLQQHGFRPFSLGPRTLRTDTACIALLAVLAQRPPPNSDLQPAT